MIRLNKKNVNVNIMLTHQELIEKLRIVPNEYWKLDPYENTDRDDLWGLLGYKHGMAFPNECISLIVGIVGLDSYMEAPMQATCYCMAVYYGTESWCVDYGYTPKERIINYLIANIKHDRLKKVA
jgi:hypothetical protein